MLMELYGMLFNSLIILCSITGALNATLALNLCFLFRYDHRLVLKHQVRSYFVTKALYLP